ncbi:MAG: universal stress protein, partial [Desulfovibrionaceae bacterium]|nr:universal stress protein [Desulfovibrionaceae bacterium]
MYKKIIIPVSGANNCERAKKTVAHALGICDGEIIFLHVADPVSDIIGGEARKELERDEAAKAATLMAPLTDFMKGKSVRYRSI